MTSHPISLVIPSHEPRRSRCPCAAQKAQRCKFCGSHADRPVARCVKAASDGDPVDRDPVSGLQGEVDEDELVEWAIAILSASGVLNNPSASMRVIEHVAETVGYRRAHVDMPNNVTEMMLMAARAATLAELFREDV